MVHKGKNVKMFLNGEEIKGVGLWKINTIPWYKRLYYKWMMHRIYKNKFKASLCK